MAENNQEPTKAIPSREFVRPDELEKVLMDHSDPIIGIDEDDPAHDHIQTGYN